MKETAGFKRRVEKLQGENHREEDSLRNLNFPVIFVFTALGWAISDEAMDLYRVNYPIVTVENTGTYEGYDSNPLDQLIDNDFSWTAENRENILNEWMEKYDSKSEAES